MKPSRWADVLHTWGMVVLAIIVFAIMTGIPYAFSC